MEKKTTVVNDERYVITSDGRRVKYSEWLEEQEANRPW